MFLRTKRLFLRPIWPEERDEMGALGAAVVDYDAPGCVQFVLTAPHRAGSEPIGWAVLLAAGETARIDLGIAEAHRGHGYAGEAVRGLRSLAAALGHATVTASECCDDRIAAAKTCTCETDRMAA